ncbi:transcription elongation factor GreA [Candidatus Peregrinibacteria bacterium]|nr:MAG: transcription elongation factor GreA [Candidatus Peregrinibacteria bacterium]
MSSTSGKLGKSQIITEDAVLLTEEGLQQLKKELQYLKTEKRRMVAERLQEAIAYGDLSENSEYEEAKNEQAFVEGRILEIEKMVKNAQLIDEKKAHSAKTVQIGTTVTIQLLEKGEKSEEFTIVGSTEADPMKSRISNVSPVGRALLGAKKGEKVKVQAPAGVFEYEILDLH